MIVVSKGQFSFKRLFGLLGVLTIIESFDWVVIRLFGINDLIFFLYCLSSSWKVNLCFLSSTVFLFVANLEKSNLLTFRVFEVLKKTIGSNSFMHDYLC